jgi:Skp family chaperone for outer membrane proteins
MQSILTDLNGVVSAIAKDKGYNLVLDSQAVVFTADQASDLTKQVEDKFNKKG